MFHQSAFSDGAAVIFLPNSIPVRRRHYAHDVVASGFAAQSSIVHALPQLVAALEKERVVVLPLFAQAPRKQLELELLDVVFHVQRQVKGDEKVLTSVFRGGELGTNEVDEHHRQSVTEEEYRWIKLDMQGEKQVEDD